MQIHDFSYQSSTRFLPIPKNSFLEIATAALLFILPVITLFLLAK